MWHTPARELWTRAASIDLSIDLPRVGRPAGTARSACGPGGGRTNRYSGALMYARSWKSIGASSKLSVPKATATRNAAESKAMSAHHATLITQIAQTKPMNQNGEGRAPAFLVARTQRKAKALCIAGELQPGRARPPRNMVENPSPRRAPRLSEAPELCQGARKGGRDSSPLNKKLPARRTPTESSFLPLESYEEQAPYKPCAPQT